MNRLIQVVALSVCYAAVTACTGGGILRGISKVSPASSYQKTSDIRYGEDPRQTMDLYVPQNKSPVPKTVVFVYGGAWRSGNKNEYEFVAKALASMGHTVLVPDYRLFPQHSYPEFINDIANAIVVCENSVEMCRPDAEPLVLMGHSAGAHTAALLATDDRFLRDAGSTVPVAGLIALSGPYDLPLDDPEVIPVFSTIKDPETGNPVALVKRGSAPPSLLLHGGKDERVRYFHTERFAAALTRADVPVTVVTVKGGHVRLLLGISSLLGFLSESKEQIEQYLEDLPGTEGSQQSSS